MTMIMEPRHYYAANYKPIQPINKLAFDVANTDGQYHTVDLAEAYIKQLEMLGRKPKTLSVIRWGLLKRLAPKVPLVPCTEVDVMQAMLDCTHMKPNSRARLLDIWGAFFNFCGLYDAARALRSQFRYTESLPRIFSLDEIQDMFEAAKAMTRKGLYRGDQLPVLLLAVALDTGLRAGEIASIRAHRIQSNWIIVNGKTGERRVPVSNSLAEAMLERATGEIVWQGVKRANRLLPRTTRSITGIFEKIYKNAGIVGPRLGPHTLRHTFATEYVRAGGDVVTLKDILGHADIQMTMQYVTLAGVDILTGHAKYSLARRLGMAGD